MHGSIAKYNRMLTSNKDGMYWLRDYQDHVMYNFDHIMLIHIQE